MKTILITGFDPFGGETVNPSWEAVKALPAQIDDIAVHKLQIPTVFGKASRTVLEYAKRIQPDCILCIGQAGGRNGITPERVAINLRDASICDNEGNRPIDTPIAENGKNAYFATVLTEGGISMDLSERQLKKVAREISVRAGGKTISSSDSQSRRASG